MKQNDWSTNSIFIFLKSEVSLGSRHNAQESVDEFVQSVTPNLTGRALSLILVSESLGVSVFSKIDFRVYRLVVIYLYSLDWFCAVIVSWSYVVWWLLGSVGPITLCLAQPAVIFFGALGHFVCWDVLAEKGCPLVWEIVGDVLLFENIVRPNENFQTLFDPLTGFIHSAGILQVCGVKRETLLFTPASKSSFYRIPKPNLQFGPFFPFFLENHAFSPILLQKIL